VKLGYLRDECYRASSSSLLGQNIATDPNSRNHVGLRTIAIGAFYCSFYHGLNIIATDRNIINLFMITNHIDRYCIVITAIFKLVFDDFTSEMEL